MTKDVPVKVSEAAYDLGQGIRKFVADTRKALADGWQPGSDIPAVLTAVYADLLSKITDLGKLGPELAENKAAFLKAFALSGEDIAEDFFKPVGQ